MPSNSGSRSFLLGFGYCDHACCLWGERRNTHDLCFPNTREHGGFDRADDVTCPHDQPHYHDHDHRRGCPEHHDRRGVQHGGGAARNRPNLPRAERTTKRSWSRWTKEALRANGVDALYDAPVSRVTMFGLSATDEAIEHPPEGYEPGYAIFHKIERLLG